MFGSGRTIGLIVIIGGISLACLGSLLTVTAVTMSTNLTMGWIIFGFALSLIVPSSLIRLGLRHFKRGQQVTQELATIKKQKKILTMVENRGQIRIGDLGAELNASPNEIRYLIYDLVKSGLLHGYINWDDGVLHARHAIVLQGATHCPSCGGEQQFSGHGVIECRHCAAQIFL